MQRQLIAAAWTLAGVASATAWQASAADTFRTPYTDTPAIAWGPCDENLVGEHASALGDRLHCGHFSAPIDHHRPDTGTLTVALVRVDAADPALRIGTLFYNPGGPGYNPMTSLPTMALYWSLAKRDDITHGYKRRLSDAYDLVGVVPRGLEGGTPFTCEGPAPLPVHNDLIADTGRANRIVAERASRLVAATCRRHTLYPYVNSEQTVHDMEMVRKALNEPRLNYYGMSYGTWLGSWYAATYPGRVGRMLLDANMDWTDNVDTNYLRAVEAQQQRFARLVVRPAVAKPEVYGLGDDETAVNDTVRQLVLPVRKAWANRYESPEALLAAKATSDWLHVTPGLGAAQIVERAARHRFSTDDDVDRRTRALVENMAASYVESSDTEPNLRLPPDESVMVATMCNDSPSMSDYASWEAVIDEYAASYPAANGSPLFNPCLRWGGPNTVRPPLSRLGQAPQILMLQAEFDWRTPLVDAENVLAAVPTTRLVIAKGSENHSVLGMTDSACIEAAAGNFLLTGELPAERRTECPPAGNPAARANGFEDPVRAAALREALGQHGNTPLL